MDEYVKKEVLIEDFKSCGASKDIVDAIIYRINQHQPADVVEVKHGEWIEGKRIGLNILQYTCSECGLWADTKFPYCHCGAKMDGEMKSL